LNKVLLTVLFAVSFSVLLGSQDAYGITIESDFPIDIVCTNPPNVQLCVPPFSTTVQTLSNLQVQYFVPQTHCSSVRVHIFLDGNPVHTTGFLSWFGAPPPFDSLPLNSGIIDLGTVTPGMHTIDVQAEGQVSGCNEGGLAKWEGALKVVTSGFDISCGAKTVLNSDNQCIPDLSQVCGQGTFPDFDALMCFGLAMEAVGGAFLDIDSVSLLVGAIGTNPVITGLVGITLGGVAAQAIWFVHRRKKSENS